MKLEILGTGCSKCKKLYEITQQAIKELAVEAEINKVDKIEDIMKYDVMIMPALAINGEIKVAGRIPSKAEITNWITTELSKK
ncbi:MAG: thioredoxin family protein [Candidatus Firestonebacteria bacterium]